MTPFSAKVAEEIFEAFPEWRVYAREDSGDDGKTYLFIEVPAPLGANTEHGLTVSTLNDEITVAFDAYHSHYTHWHVSEPDCEHLAASPFVQSILAEEVAVASWWHGDHCGGACQFRTDEDPNLRFADGYDRIRVRSWHGTANRDRTALQGCPQK